MLLPSTFLFLLSAWSTPKEAWSWGHKLHSNQGYLEAATTGQAARPNPRLPGHLLSARERRTPEPAKHHGRCFARGTGTGWCFVQHSSVFSFTVCCALPVIVILHCTFLSFRFLDSHFISPIPRDTHGIFLSSATLLFFFPLTLKCNIWLHYSKIHSKSTIKEGLKYFMFYMKMGLGKINTVVFVV